MSSLVVGLVLAFAYCWQMSLVMLGSIPVMAPQLHLDVWKRTRTSRVHRKNQLETVP